MSKGAVLTMSLGSGIVADAAAGTISEQADGLLSIQSEQDNSSLVSKQPRSYTPLPRVGPGVASEGSVFFLLTRRPQSWCDPSKT